MTVFPWRLCVLAALCQCSRDRIKEIDRALGFSGLAEGFDELDLELELLADLLPLRAGWQFADQQAFYRRLLQ